MTKKLTVALCFIMMAFVLVGCEYTSDSGVRTTYNGKCTETPNKDNPIVSDGKVYYSAITSCNSSFIKKGDDGCHKNACLGNDGLCYDMPINAVGCTKQIHGAAKKWGIQCAETIQKNSDGNIVCLSSKMAENLRQLEHQEYLRQQQRYQNTTQQNTTPQNITSNSTQSLWCQSRLQQYEEQMWDYRYCLKERDSDIYKVCLHPVQPIGC